MELPKEVVLPPDLVNTIRAQSAVLFLGAGASHGARHPDNRVIPNANELKSLLSERFLDGKPRNRSLPHIADICISATSLPSVQEFIREIFLPFSPAEHHLIIPRFIWHSIVTTNYDLIVEQAYQQENRARQTLCPFTNDLQRIDTELKSVSNGVRYIKLHGCIKNLDNNVPLILSTEQYVKHATTRERLFGAFRGDGYENSFIFCGYSIDDPHIQKILFDLDDLEKSRPRYFIVNPDLDDLEIQYWAGRRITAVRATLKDFLFAIQEAIPEHNRSIPISLGGGTQSVRNFYKVSRPNESERLRLFLSQDVDHVRPNIATSVKRPEDFYVGADPGWGPIEADLDVPRAISDNVVSDAILEDEHQRQRVVDLHVVKGPAGHGKTTTLRRAAWDAAITFSKLCLFLKDDGTVRVDQLTELSHLTKERIFLFIDRAALRVDEIRTAIVTLSDTQIPLTVVTAERDNEWNVRCGALDAFVAQEYPMRNLSPQEIHVLLQKLEEHNSLGQLSELTYEERVAQFQKRAQSQLLVALHEATLGRPFEEIVKDEFDRIIPIEAKRLYLDVCTLNRLGVPVRAGLISRVSGIRFHEFRERFLKPLEHVVSSRFDRYVGDRMYSARHQHIADLVFQLALPDGESRYEQILRIMHGMNVLYTSDYDAFRSLIRGRTVGELFGSLELGRRLYEHAERIVYRDAHLLQQRAVFEMTHPGGRLDLADTYLSSAASIAPDDRTIKHTMANLKRQEANSTTNPLLRNKLRTTSRAFLDQVLHGDSRSHGYHTLVLLLTDQLRDLLSEKGNKNLDRLEENTVVELIREIEITIRDGQQRFPDEDRLLTAESTFRELLQDDQRAYEALQRAFEKNPRSEWLAIRISKRFSDSSMHDKAKSVLLRCVRENPGSRAVQFALAQHYIFHGTSDERVDILQLLRRSFVDDDSHFDAQYWYARELVIRDRVGEANRLFAKLRHAPLSPYIRNRIRGVIRDENGGYRRFEATVRKKEESYVFARPSGFPVDVYCHRSQASDELWSHLSVGSAIEMAIGFSMRGPAGMDLSNSPGSATFEHDVTSGGTRGPV